MGLIKRSILHLQVSRLPQFAAAYGAGCWVVLEVVDQLIGNEILPQLFYQLALVLVVTLAPGVLVVAWFHGEKGAQDVPPIEKWLLASVAMLALASTSLVYRGAGTVLPDDTGPAANRVAVLYLEDLSSDQEFQHVADGLTEGIIRRLGQVQALDVISRNGVAPFRDADVSLDSIARALRAGSLIDGSVERRGDRLRIEIRLLEGGSAATVQRASLELPASDLIVAQDSTAQEVARLMREWIGEEVRLREQQVVAANTLTWSLLQRGEKTRKDAEALLIHDADGAVAAFAQADSILELAEAADPSWVEPILRRGEVAYGEFFAAHDAREAASALERAIGHTDRALELSPGDAQALGLRGTLRYRYWLADFPHDATEAENLFAAARQDLETAVDIDPTLASAHSALSHLFFQTEDVLNVVLSARRAYDADAYLSVADVIVWRLYSGYYELEQPDQAQRWCDEGRRRFPGNYRFAECRLWLMTTDVMEADPVEAWRLLEELATLVPDRDSAYQVHVSQMVVGGILGLAGLADSARSVLVTARAGRDVDPRVLLPFYEAYMRVLLGDRDEAVELLRRWVTAHPEADHGIDDVNWWWRDLLDYPPFRELVSGGAG